MRWKNTSSEDKAKVITAKLNNPDLSTRDLEEKTGINYMTASRIIKQDLWQVVTQSKVIAQMIDDNNKLLDITGAILVDDLIHRIENKEEVRKDELVRIRDLAYKQNTLAWMSDKDKEKMTITIEM